MSGCVSGKPAYEPEVRTWPSAAAIVPDPKPRPEVNVGDDLGQIAGRWRSVALENGTRLITGKCNYLDAAPSKEPKSIDPVCADLRAGKEVY